MTADRWREIEALFHAAQDCSPHRRAELLAQAEPDLRREVESLLAQRSGTGPLDGFAVDLLESAAGETGGTAPTGRVMRLQPGMSLRCLHRAVDARPRRDGRSLSRARHEARS